MNLTTLQLGDQTIRFDRESTAALHARYARGWAEECACVGCRNLLAQRESVYPPAFLELLERLGIDFTKERVVNPGGPMANGLHFYGGGFPLVGEVLVAGGSVVVVTESPYFSYFFNWAVPECEGLMPDEPHIWLEFMAHIPWVLAEDWNCDSEQAHS